MSRPMPTLVEVEARLAAGSETARLLELRLRATRRFTNRLTEMRETLMEIERFQARRVQAQTRLVGPMVDVKVTIPYSKYRKIIESIPVTKSSMEKHSIPESCCICLDAFKRGSKVHKTPCGHFYHATCLRKQLVKVGPPRCPMCRFDVRGE